MGLWQHFSVCSTELQLPSHCEIELLNLVCHRAHSHRQAHGCGRCRTTREDSLWPAMQHSCTACASSRIAILVSKPQKYTGSNATSLLLQLCLLWERAGLRPRVPTTLLLETVRLWPWTRGLMLLRERTGLRPRVTNHTPLGEPSGSGRGRGDLFLSRTQSSSAPLGEGWAPAASANHAPLKDCQAPALDEGPFLSRTQGSSAPPGRGPGSGRGYQPRSPGRPSGSGRGRGSFSVQNSEFFG